MKKWLALTLLLFCIPALVWGWGTVIISGSVPTSSSCSTPSYGDELNEGFVGSGYENANWSETGSPDEDASLPGSPPTECCLEGLNINGSDTTAVYSEYDFGTTLSYPVDIIFYVYFSTITIPTDYESIYFLQWDDDTLPSSLQNYIMIKNAGGEMTLRAKGATTSDSIPISIGNWHKIKLHLDSTDTSSYIQVDDGTQHTFQRTSDLCRYLRLGYCFDLDSGEALNVYCGYIYVSTP